MRPETSLPIRLEDYRVPDYLVETVDLDFALDPRATLVRARTGPRVTSAPAAGEEPAEAVRTASAGSSPAAPATPKPRADHPWRKPVLASKRTKSLDT